MTDLHLYDSTDGPNCESCIYWRARKDLALKTDRGQLGGCFGDVAIVERWSADHHCVAFEPRAQSVSIEIINEIH